MVECTIEEIQGNVVKPWNVIAGELTEVNIGGSIFAVRKDTTVDPIKAAKDFLEAFDISRTTVLRKAGVKNTPNTTVPSERTPISKQFIDRTNQPLIQTKRTGEIVGKAYNLPVIKDDITGFYRIKPDTFTMETMKDYFKNVYINNVPAGKHKLSENSVLNKQRATLKFLTEKGYVKQIEGKGNYKRKYQWKEVPYGAKPAAQAEVSSEYFKDLQKRQLMDLRNA